MSDASRLFSHSVDARECGERQARLQTLAQKQRGKSGLFGDSWMSLKRYPLDFLYYSNMNNLEISVFI